VISDPLLRYKEDEMENWLDEMNIPVLDVQHITENPKNILHNNGHLNPTGNLLVAKEVAKWLIEEPRFYLMNGEPSSFSSD